MTLSTTAIHPATEREEARAKWFTLGAICVAFFMLAVNSTLVNVALPTLQRSFNASTSSLEWIINGYALNNNSTDACGIAGYTASPSSFGCADLGSHAVMLIAYCFLDTIKKLDRMQWNRSDGFHKVFYTE